MDAIKKYEELPPVVAKFIRQAFPGIQGMVMRVNDIDPSRGTGIIDDETKCVWTTGGHRITMSGKVGGARIGTCSKEPDPMAPPGVDP